VAVASLALLLIYAFPLWTISLEAPQYPEGLGMEIWVSTITGENPHDLRNINSLNHYIGMKTIEPDAIRELAVMPWVVGFLVVSGLAVAAARRAWLLYGWFALLAVLALAGILDFWLWQYDYGHDLSPDAAIKIPGMSYQPPLIGSRSILNFRAHSWPGLGGWAAFGAGVLGALAVFLELRRWRGSGAQEASDASEVRKMAPALAALLLPAAVLLVAGCAPSSPVPIAYGEDTCALCVMTVSDDRYGTELITRKGRAHMFDSVECMANFYLTQERSEVASMWVTDFRNPGRLIPLAEAVFLRSPDLRSPMGMNLTAFWTGEDPQALLASYGGEILDWEGVLEVVRRGGGPGAGMHGMHGMHGGHSEELRATPEPQVR